jgi:hypothetical protein
MYRQIFVASSRDEKAPPVFIAQIVDAFIQAFEIRSPVRKSANSAQLRRVQ